MRRTVHYHSLTGSKQKDVTVAHAGNKSCLTSIILWPETESDIMITVITNRCNASGQPFFS